MDILQVETERKLLEERRNVALSACLEEERRHERLVSECVTLDGVIKLKTRESVSLDEQITAQNSVLITLKQEIRETVATKDAIIARKLEEVAWEEENYKVALMNRDGLNNDIIRAQLSLNEVRTEIGEKQDQLKQQGELLTSLLISVQEESTKLTNLIASQEQERISLKKQSEVLELQSKNLETKEKDLYILRGDLTIIRDRYAAFAQEHSLPFNA